MVPDVSTGERTRGLLAYLFGPGRRDEHTDPHIVAAFALPGLPDPGRLALSERQDALTDLAKYLDQPVRVREQRTGKKVPQYVWHCPVRTAPGDHYLTDEEWAEVARRVVEATGIAPRDDDSGCRWIAVRHAGDHIHIMATSVREDGRRPNTHRDGARAQKACREIEKEFGLRQLKSGDMTAPENPTSAERAKADRMGAAVTSREWLRDQAYAVLASARSEEEFFTVLSTLGIKAKKRIGPQTGEVTGYSLAAPGDTNTAGEPVYFSGSTLAPDLSLNRIREVLTTQQAAGYPVARPRPENPWAHAYEALHDTATVLDSGDDAAAQAHLAALGDLLHTAARSALPDTRAELRAAAAEFNRARRSVIRADHISAAAMRATAKNLVHAPSDPGGLAVAVIFALLQLAIAAAHWYEQRGYQQQAAAAHATVTHLRAGYQQAAAPVLADLAHRTPRPEIAQRFETAVRQTIPDQADRILTDPAWPALATTLAQAETAGHHVPNLLRQVAAGRELDSAQSPAEVINWRLTATPNRRAQAAQARSTTAGGTPAASAHVQASRPAAAPDRRTPRRS
ncbi:relaxase/mobilization nuclease domain-containing protein [Streptomyces polygonati]|uniref:Relaxase/mobilization nuclease domain-containing protein n=1 Tax=Streptomyces polygonati TaxID=1617087 RepID=A0ABV8HQD1_9ACTN